MDNLNAAIGLQSLKDHENNCKIREKNWNYLYDLICESKDIKYVVPQNACSSNYLFTVRLKYNNSTIIRDYMMREHKVQATYHYPILQHNRMIDPEDLTNDEIINLPIHEELSEKDIEKVAASFKEALAIHV